MVAIASVAQAKLEPYLEKLSTCIDQGWADFKKECGHIGHKTSPRTRACIVHDNIIHRAKKLFAEENEVFLYERNGTLILQISEEFVLRFKKLDEDKLSTGIATQERMDFLKQMELPGVPRGTNIIAGYELNKLQTDIKELSITCPIENQNVWILKLQRSEAEIIPIQTQREEKSSTVKVKESSIFNKVEEING